MRLQVKNICMVIGHLYLNKKDEFPLPTSLGRAVVNPCDTIKKPLVYSVLL